MAKKGANDYILEKGVEESFKISCIILYGGAARYHFDISPEYDDYDLNIFFEKNDKFIIGNGRKVNRRGSAKKIGLFRGKKVELLFNVLNDEENVFDFIKTRSSKRWENRISKEPILVLYPDRKDIRSLTT